MPSGTLADRLAHPPSPSPSSINGPGPLKTLLNMLCSNVKRIITRTKAPKVNKSRRRDGLPLAGANPPLFPDRTTHSLIQWPSDHQILEVSRRLARISRQGARWEASGDYFNSGDLAYQLQEIIRATTDLFRKIQRLKH